MGLIYVPVQTTPNLTSFTTKLKKLTDKRDNRGKRHELAFVLGGVVLAIMSGRSYAFTARPAAYPEPAQVVMSGIGLPTKGWWFWLVRSETNCGRAVITS